MSKRIKELAKTLHHALIEEGIDSELNAGDHEGLVAARVADGDDELHIVIHISDRARQTAAFGSIDQALVATHVSSARQVPTLGTRAGAGGTSVDTR